MIDPPLLGRLRELAGAQFEELAGAIIAGEVPLTNAVVNRLIGLRLAGGSGAVSAVQLDALDDDTFSAQVTVRATMIPVITLVARIEEQPQLPGHAILGVRWSLPGMGPLGLLARSALPFLKALPRGLRADDDRILVDVAELVRAQGLGGFLPFLSKLEVHTRKGAFLLRFELRAH